jgi:hypothetical protein
MSLALLLSSAALAADLQVAWLIADCHPDTGLPWVQVSVLNASDVTAMSTIDLFVGVDPAPTIGTTSMYRRTSRPIAPWMNDIYEVTLLDVPRDAVRLDVLLDTLNMVSETDEGNNHADYYANFQYCF